MPQTCVTLGGHSGADAWAAQDAAPHVSGCHGAGMADVVLWSGLGSRNTRAATLHLSIIGF